MKKAMIILGGLAIAVTGAIGFTPAGVTEAAGGTCKLVNSYTLDEESTVYLNRCFNKEDGRHYYTRYVKFVNGGLTDSFGSNAINPQMKPKPIRKYAGEVLNHVPNESFTIAVTKSGRTLDCDIDDYALTCDISERPAK